MAYCSEDDVRNRLSSVGALYLIDDDDDSSEDASETALLTDAITYAGQEIAAALTPWLDNPSTAEGNVWLKYRCIGLAVEYLFGRKGHTVTQSVQDFADRCREDLGDVKDGSLRVPSLTYPIDGTDPQRLKRRGLPVVQNPGCSPIQYTGRFGRVGRRY